MNCQSHLHRNEHPAAVARRWFLRDCGVGLGSLALADLMGGRSGAGTVMETAMVGLPTVFVPLPHGNGEQARNARFLVEADAALLVADSDLSPDLLAATVLGLVRQPGRLATMSSTCRELVPAGAAEALAELVLQAGKGE